MDLSVDVAMVTYNHSSWIRQAIHSVLEQRTSFPVRVIVGDDCSIDGTAAIVSELAARHPDRVVPVLYDRHVGLRSRDKVASVVYAQLTAPYVALLDGDDFWTDPLKLQKQVDFLQAHPECSICSHPVAIECSGQRISHFGPRDGVLGRSVLTLGELLEDHMGLPSASMLMRWSALDGVPTWFWDVVMADLALVLLFGSLGAIGHLPECMATIRKHEGGVSRALDDDPRFWAEEAAKVYSCVDAHFGGRSRPALERRMMEAWLYKAWTLRCAREWRACWSALSFYLRSDVVGLVRKAATLCAFFLPAPVALCGRDFLRRLGLLKA